MTRARAGLAGGLVLGLACLPLAVDAVRAPGVIGHGGGVVRDVLLWAVLGASAAACLRLAPLRAGLAVALLLGLALRLVALPARAPLSDDLYRYAWDGRVQAAGIDPYRYPPSDDRLAALRDPEWLWAARSCRLPATASLPRRRACLLGTALNRPDARTIYPPGAEAWFLALHLAGVTRAHDRGLEGAGLGIDLSVCALLLVLLRRSGRDLRGVAAWALSPLPVLETVADAHVDGLALLAVLGALALARRRRVGAAGAVLGLAVLVKLFPLVVLPALLGRVRGNALRPVTLAAAGCGVVVTLGYLPHVLAVGARVLGYLPGYLREEDYASGGRFRLLGAVGVTGSAAAIVAVAVLGVVAGVVLRRRPEPVVGAVWLLGALLLLTTPVQPWYAVVLGGVAVAAGRPEWLAVGVAGYPGYVLTVQGRPAAAVATACYAAAAGGVAAAALLRRRRQVRSGAAAKPAIPTARVTAGR